ncbi:MAG: RICIN domain-containing protein [Pseudomonadota bacterium]
MLKSLVTAFAAMLAAGGARAEIVEIYVVDMLDNIQNGYCLDIAKGQGEKANPADGLQAHTCYSPSAEIFVDQAFDADQFAGGVLYMPDFDVCMQAPSVGEGASVELAACDRSEAQSWAFDGEGAIEPAAAPGMCLTLTGETRTGRSKENQMKALTLEACSDEQAPAQTWATRTAD